MIQVPPDSTGKLVETVTNASTQEREVMVIGSPTTSLTVGQNLAPVTSSAGLVVNISSGTVTSTAATNPWSSAPGFNVPVMSVSSGLIQLSSQITVTATGPVTVTSGLISITSGTITSTAATNPWSSAPGFNIPTVSVSSGLTQVSAIQISPTSSVAGAGLVVITSSFGLVTQSTQPVTITSGTISLSSQITVTATGPVTITSGTVTLSSVPTVTATAATNPWSSAPGFNLPVVNVSSGLIQVSAIQVSPTSSVAGAGFGPVTSSAGVLASLSSGTVSLSSQITVTATGPVTITSGIVTLSSIHTVTATAGTNPWSSAPGFNLPIVSVSSGLIQLSSQITVTATGPVTITSGLVSITSGTVTATAATNPWSSAPGFNLPVLTVSSGLTQVTEVSLVTSIGMISTYFQSTGGAASVNVRGSASMLMGYSYFNSTATPRSIKVYNTSSAPTVGSTTNVLLILFAPGSTGGGGANVVFPNPGLFSSNGIGFTMTANVAGTDTGAPGLNDLTLNLYIV